MRNIKDHLIYYLSLLLSIGTVIGIVFCVYFGVTQLITGNSDNIIYYGAGAIVCAILYKVMFYIRTNAREKVEFDEFGNKKGNVYKNLSAKEKKEIDLQRLADAERLISSGELKKVTFKGSKNPEEELNRLIGLKDVKEEILKMKAKMEYDKTYNKKNKKNKENISSYHMCFLGSPGTGKTTIARIMAGLLYQYGYIKENKCIEIDAAFLKGSTPDDTLKRTKVVLEKSRNGVLFIDEAYSLLSGVNSSELIAELVKYMEDNKDNFILILAGYQNDMKDLINSNPGLYSRISKYLWFKDYTMEELKDIFTLVANENGYCVELEAYERFEKRIIKEKAGKNFGNARSVKNIFQKVLDKHAYNVISGVIDKSKAYYITGEDVDIITDEGKIFNT